jgi:hypothetical protein
MEARMPSDDAKDPQMPETKLSIGWQRLTKQEFVEALTAALLDKVRDRRQEEAKRPSPYIIRPERSN